MRLHPRPGQFGRPPPFGSPVAGKGCPYQVSASTITPSPYNCALFQIQETPDVDTSELISAAASIAGHLAARAFATGSMSSDEIQQIARTAVQIAREIENEARQL